MQGPAPIDLRSDTFTKPTDAMRAAMAAAEVGDDVFSADPTVLRLQQMAAEMLGKEASLFMPSGSMANQVAIRLQTRPGDEVLIESLGHSFDWENGAAAVISGVQLRPVAGDHGELRPRDIAPHLLPRPYYRSRVRMLILENTHNMSGGRALAAASLAATAAAAREAGLATHLDGARLFNAAVALGEQARAFCEPFDTVTVSLSKGLSAPIGSLLAGSAELIEQARRQRKLLGGGMRQVGVIAAAGIVALQDGPGFLLQDHANARALADGLLAGGRLRLTFGHVDTNIVIVSVAGLGMDAEAFVAAAAGRGVVCTSVGPQDVRFVTYRNIDAGMVQEALRRLQPLIG